MNIKQAKNIPIHLLVEQLGGKAHLRTKKDIWYFSPFRPDENTPSFKIIPAKNYWHDFATGQGGSILDLWLDFHGQDRKSSSGLKAALEALEQFSGSIPKGLENTPLVARLKPDKTASEKERFCFVKSPSKIWMESLKVEVVRRGISQKISERYLKQAYFEDTTTNKKFNGFAFGNDKGGYEISVPNPNKGTSFKTVIGAKAPTTIQGRDYVGFVGYETKTAYVFEGFWDFLSWLEISKEEHFEQKVFVMNSLSFTKEVGEQIIAEKGKIDTVLLFLDNDDAGTKATLQLAEILGEEGFIVGSMHEEYDGFKDLNDFWQQKKGSKIHTFDPQKNDPI